MVKHQKCHGVNDVDKFLNGSGLRLDQVQIVYGLTRVGGDYFVFYDTDDVETTEEKPAEPAKRKPKVATESELLLTDVTGSKLEPTMDAGSNGKKFHLQSGLVAPM